MLGAHIFNQSGFNFFLICLLIFYLKAVLNTNKLFALISFSFCYYPILVEIEITEIYNFL